MMCSISICISHYTSWAVCASIKNVPRQESFHPAPYWAENERVWAGWGGFLNFLQASTSLCSKWENIFLLFIQLPISVTFVVFWICAINYGLAFSLLSSRLRATVWWSRKKHNSRTHSVTSALITMKMKILERESHSSCRRLLLSIWLHLAVVIVII